MYNSRLTAFVCVADCGSFNRAAERLYLSPPAIMKQVNALERHLDLKLLDRTNQGIRLTPAGRVIYRHAKYLFDYSAKAIAEARREAQPDLVEQVEAGQQRDPKKSAAKPAGKTDWMDEYM